MSLVARLDSMFFRPAPARRSPVDDIPTAEARFWSELAAGGRPVILGAAGCPVVFSAPALWWAVCPLSESHDESWSIRDHVVSSSREVLHVASQPTPIRRERTPSRRRIVSFLTLASAALMTVFLSRRGEPHEE
jgi:hypothetical protein